MFIISNSTIIHGAENVRSITHLQAMRVDLRNSLAGFYVLVVPDQRKGPAFRDFYLIEDDTGRTLHMFGTAVQDDRLAAEMAAFAAPQHIDILLQEVE